MKPDFERHSEFAKAKVRAAITELVEQADSLAGWMGTAGYDTRDMQRVHDVVAGLRGLYGTVVLVHEEAELFDINRGRAVSKHPASGLHDPGPLGTDWSY